MKFLGFLILLVTTSYSLMPTLAWGQEASNSCEQVLLGDLKKIQAELTQKFWNKEGFWEIGINENEKSIELYLKDETFVESFKELTKDIDVKIDIIIAKTPATRSRLTRTELIANQNKVEPLIKDLPGYKGIGAGAIDQAPGTGVRIYIEKTADRSPFIEALKDLKIPYGFVVLGVMRAQ